MPESSEIGAGGAARVLNSTVDPYAFLKRYAQFVPASVYPDPERPGKLKKVTLDRDGRHVDAHDSANWMTAEEARTFSPNISFVLKRTPGATCIWCLDLDGCINPDGSWSALAQQFYYALGDTVLWEKSVSGLGLHIYGWGHVPPQHAKKNTPLRIEFYTDKRHIVIGSYVCGSMEAPCDTIGPLVAAYFPPRAESEYVPDEGPVAEWRGPADDEDLLRRARMARSTASMFSGRASFADLWDRNEKVLTQSYPDGEGGYDASSADAALASHLAFWTGKDVARIERLMRQSALARPKWDERSDYLVERTIMNGCASCREVCVDRESAVSARSVEASEASPIEAKNIEGASSFCDREGQRELFKGCVLIVQPDKGGPAILMPNGMMLTQREFDAKFSGPDFLQGGPRNRTTKSAWEAFTRSQDTHFPRVDRPAFRPKDPYMTVYGEPGEPRTINVYRPRGRFKQGDPTPFVEHIRKILPRGDDALILTSFLAACVQHVGVKFTWAVVLASPAEGAGKGLLTGVMIAALGREYVHQPKAAALTSNFNSWVRDSLLVVVSDMPPNASEALLEALKPLITDGEGASIEAKGADQVSADIFCNFLFTTNHKSGIRKTANDRRYCMLFCAQNDAGDLKRDGLDEAYFTRFVDWLTKRDGREIAAEYLRTFQIPERYDPTRGAVRAPLTSSTLEALEVGRDELSQALVDAVESGTPGFRGGWVSFNLLKMLATQMRVPAGQDRLLRALESEGYMRCPGLTGGRTDNPVLPDGKKAVLWVKKLPNQVPNGLPNAPAEIARAYTLAQTQGDRFG